ncbi:MAG: type II toxin-antitoxin system RelE/ParE family toxin [Aestuariibacter sp.]
MTTNYKIKATPTFKISLDKLTSFLTRKFSAVLAREVKRKIKNRVEEQLSTAPYSSPASERLVELGIVDYRQLLIDEHNIVLYRVDDTNNTVVLLLTIDSRQDLEKLLFEINILT